MKPGHKTAYREFCQSAAAIPLFHQPWWLDAVCGPENWQVALVRNADTASAEGVLPYYTRSRYGVRMVTPPPLTPFLGPLIFPPEGLNLHKQRAFEERVVRGLLRQLPDVTVLRLKLNYDQNNWLPFRWEGFRQTTRYSYRIQDLSDIDRVWSNFHPKLRNKINHATRHCHVQQLDDAEPVFRLYEKRLQRQGQAAPISWQWLASLDRVLVERKSRAAFLCSDRNERPLAGAYIAWDQHSSYLLLTGFDEGEPIRGATALAVWSSMQFVAGLGLIYDFEGSMLSGVERFFREFGGELCAYHYLVRYKNKFWGSVFNTML